MIGRVVCCMLLAPGIVAAQAVPGAAASRSQTSDSAAVAESAAVNTGPKVRLGAFIDGYYAWDVDRPSNFDRAYTTQPARHAEFNINLAFVEASLAGPRLRGRLALQWGTSVQANYAGEPRLGGVSGPSVSQFLQEASVGYQLGRTLWVDGGIFFAHTGFEGWISRDNLSYSRSLIADFSPYYETGVKLTWAASSVVTAQFVLVNGWQNISNYNTPPAAGVRVDYAVSPRVTLSYDNFVGNVAADSLAAQLRFYQDFMAQYNPSSRWQFAAAAAYGVQTRSTASGATATWYGASLFAKYHPTPRVGVVARLERFADPDQVIVRTGLPTSFQTNGASLGLDIALTASLLWRTEVRAFGSRGAVWPANRAGRYTPDDAVAVTSLSLRY